MMQHRTMFKFTELATVLIFRLLLSPLLLNLHCAFSASLSLANAVLFPPPPPPPVFHVYTLYTRRLQAIAILMYKVKNGLAPPYIADLFAVTNSQYHLRNHDFVIPRFRTVAYRKHSLTYLGPAIWSKLDISIRLSESLGTFKKRIKLVNFIRLLDSTCKDCFLCNN